MHLFQTDPDLGRMSQARAVLAHKNASTTEIGSAGLPHWKPGAPRDLRLWWTSEDSQDLIRQAIEETTQVAPLLEPFATESGRPTATARVAAAGVAAAYSRCRFRSSMPSSPGARRGRRWRTQVPPARSARRPQRPQRACWPQRASSFCAFLDNCVRDPCGSRTCPGKPRMIEQKPPRGSPAITVTLLCVAAQLLTVSELRVKAGRGRYLSARRPSGGGGPWKCSAP